LKRWASSDWGLVLFDRRLAPKAEELRRTCFALAVSAPDAALDHLLRQLVSPEWSGASVPLPAGVSAEAGVVVGPGTTIGEGTVLEAGVRIGANVRIGRGCRIGAHSRIGDGCELGDRVTLTASVSVGGQGFGFASAPGSTPRPRLHVGGVRVGDDVRIGAFVAIDRGVFEDTVLGRGTALDNLVQVAHNCAVGRDGVLCAFVGLSGSTELGDRVTLAGLVGTKGHVRVGDGVTVAAQSGISRDLPDGSGVWKGYPPRPLAETLKTQALVDRLPELYERLRKLEKEKT
jgi:UDP-3-O-[3-hydroxymyristoyl] glucosamine N-acyltransferase